VLSTVAFRNPAETAKRALRTLTFPPPSNSMR
jgi:hypothetical protein